MNNIKNNMPNNDEFFMSKALEQAKLSWHQHNEVPVGAVIVHDQDIIAVGSNLSITKLDPTAHAEIIALRAAAQVVGNYRLAGASLYVTLEPCAMCVGAMLHARVARLVFGAWDKKFGAIESVVKLTEYPWNHKFNYSAGVLEAECAAVLKQFFQEKR